MSSGQAFILGILQGLTEFLPVSSSGHLVIAQQLFGLEASGDYLLRFDLALHFGTLLAVIVVFYRDIGQMITGTARLAARPRAVTLREDFGARMALWVVIGTIPAGVIGIAFKDFWAELFTSARAAAVMLLVTGVILWLTRFVRHTDRNWKKVGMRDALAIGMAQAFAIFPGISRSGTTIAAALFTHWDRDLAARFSFWLAIPAILGGIVFEWDAFQAWQRSDLIPLLIGTTAAAVAGFFAIHWLLRVVRRGRLHLFSYYCWAVGIATLVWFSV